MMITFTALEGHQHGFSVINPVNLHQTRPSEICKESFAYRLREMSAKDGVVMFLRRDGRTNVASTELAKHQEQILHVFEKAMGFTPLAKVELYQREEIRAVLNPDTYTSFNKKVKTCYFLYTVSQSWKANYPINHILALLVRNYYPAGEPLEWKAILAGLSEIDYITKEVIADIIQNKGQIDATILTNGISDYAYRIGHKQINSFLIFLQEMWTATYDVIKKKNNASITYPEPLHGTSRQYWNSEIDVYWISVSNAP